VIRACGVCLRADRKVKILFSNLYVSISHRSRIFPKMALPQQGDGQLTTTTPLEAEGRPLGSAAGRLTCPLIPTVMVTAMMMIIILILILILIITPTHNTNTPHASPG
jgi:hypothetical protein